MQKKLLLSFTLFAVLPSFSQTNQFDIATFVPPQGWHRIEAGGTLAFLDSTTLNGQMSFCHIILYPSSATSSNADKNFKNAWRNLVIVSTGTKEKPLTQKEKTPDGWTVVTGTTNIITPKMTYKTIVANISGFGKTMSVQVNTAGGDYAGILEKFFGNLNLNTDTQVVNNSTNTNSISGMNNYEFIAPQNWKMQSNTNYISILNLQSGCEIKILSPQNTSGNLEQDTRAVFDLMYKGWQYQRSGKQQYDLSKGFLPKGLEYCMMEAPMSGNTADGRYELEEGSAMVVKTGNQIVIISIRHKSSSLGHDDCYRNYNTLARFVNSFTVKNTVLPAINEDNSQRIVGLWKIVATGVVVGDYVFAANGNFQSGGGIGSSTTTSDMYYQYIYNRAYPFEGDGSYSISGPLLTLKKRGANAEQVTIRFEKINHGGMGWTDRIYMLRNDNNGESESRYEKQMQ